MIVQFDLVCTECGRTFTHRNRKRSHAEADVYRAWAHEHITLCPDCYRAQFLLTKSKKEVKRMIPFDDFRRLLGDVSECSDVEQYIAECGGSVPLDDADEVIRLLRTVWAMADGGLTVKKIAAACGRSVRSLSRGYDIPERTLEDWSRGAIAPRAWTLPLVAYAAMTDYLAAAE